mmetsp:Transcript_10704/g.19389  ORF Transcript_10704/g.19389 Transcript_10704/m.19389 type:complete len:255 (-) Transcript_10704:481-1245(-)
MVFFFILVVAMDDTTELSFFFLDSFFVSLSILSAAATTFFLPPSSSALLNNDFDFSSKLEELLLLPFAIDLLPFLVSPTASSSSLLSSPLPIDDNDASSSAGVFSLESTLVVNGTATSSFVVHGALFFFSLSPFLPLVLPLSTFIPPSSSHSASCCSTSISILLSSAFVSSFGTRDDGGAGCFRFSHASLNAGGIPLGCLVEAASRRSVVSLAVLLRFALPFTPPTLSTSSPRFFLFLIDESFLVACEDGHMMM